ncbi:MAG: efflux RND transporter permease subunit [Arhodomonas sp.]|nr:efflux RND transporter permease subunit [Arhodomonas sp.]
MVTVSTAYPGASSELVKGFVTTPLQQAIAEAEGIDYISATSTQGSSTIEVHMELNYDANAAVAEIQAKVASQRNVLPAGGPRPGDRVLHGRQHGADVSRLLQREHARRRRSRTTWRAWFSPSSRPCRAWPRRG